MLEMFSAWRNILNFDFDLILLAEVSWDEGSKGFYLITGRASGFS